MIWYDTQWENPLFWFDKPLKYSLHAKERTIERDLPFIDYLPLNAKYLYHTLKTDVFSLTFEIDVNFKTIHIAINTYDTVMTVYPKVITKADKFQFKYKQYLGAFKQPEDYLPPVITDLDFTEGDYIEGLV